MDYFVKPAESIKGEIKVPGDKSITHRAMMLASIASGQSRLTGVLEGEDCLATKKVFEHLGVNFIKENDDLIVEGVGIKGLRQPERELDFGNSGTGIRLSSGILVAQNFATELIGDSSLSERPMSRIVEPLSLMGANISSNQGTLPLNILPTSSLRGITFSLPVASAQVKSALLLAGLYAEGYTEVKEDKITRNHTETIFNEFGIPVEVNKSKNSRSIRVSKSDKINPKDINIPSDFSSAAFFILAALITPKSHLRIRGVGINETRIGFLHALRHMGGKIDIQNIQNGPEPIADLLIESSKLKGITLNTKLVANMIDEMPAFFIAASLAEGTTIVKDAEELRAKESDRLEAMANALGSLGVKFKLNQDGIVIHGLGDKGQFKASEINSLGDHRIAMASSIASLRADGEVRIVDCDNVGTSFPDFIEVCGDIGIKIKEQ
ncbi:MAG: 3-phosphoshikimate 1-carboxyvinyltransferase [Pseudomonadota bacterium]|nr:3-phosphoshikimate 1-carboxyvinyltransferase [Pseudomonadota bacterium]|tara:strand:- start:1659 stop:2972 length:1314 start_codon:yes stop_codon:yes gene_type:complete